MQVFTLLIALASAGLVTVRGDGSAELLTDIKVISNYWGQYRPYSDEAPSLFGVENTGLPYGCGYEQVHVLHRHGARYPTGADEDAVNDDRFAAKIYEIVSKEGAAFSGPLTDYLGRSVLVPTGAAQDYTSGTSFWNTRGRLLYNATIGQPYYNASFVNGTTRPKPVLRTTSQARILDSALAWANGFFGPDNTTSKYDLVQIYEGGTENNTLASYDSCINDNVAAIGYTGDAAVFTYIANGFLSAATDRLNQYLVDGQYSLNDNDTYAMMNLCAFEYAAYGSSDFCYQFTQSEWEGFEYTLDLEYYYDYAYGNAIGRAQGIGYLQELIARLTHQYIYTSNTSVNSSLDNNPTTFPLDQKFYMDMSHDDILISVLVAESAGFLRDPLPIDAVPPPANRTFRLSNLTPFGTRLYTEVIGCAVANPAEVATTYTQTFPESNGYDANNATYKFIRQVWNNAVVPLATIDGGMCAGRTDGLCALDNFLASQKDAEAKANYAYACFANYTDTAGNGDGAVFA